MNPHEKPILFSAPMVRALLNGTKSQTRRVVKMRDAARYTLHAIRDDGTAIFNLNPGLSVKTGRGDKIQLWMPTFGVPCPYGKKFENLWVKETFMPDPYINSCAATIYRATETEPERYTGHNWKPSIFMPRVRSRITLEITAVRVERLQDISEGDAWAEGCRRGEPTDNGGYFPAEEPDPSGIGSRGWDCPQDWYADLWESINGTGSWALNPFMWVLEFKNRHD